ncbi:MAG: MarR family transcriptional regulator for hemolysin [Gammaproteobacteria bacterium]|jgi:MarR family transcriptional regulator for hemolysin
MKQENLDRNFGFILHDVARLLRNSFDRQIKDLGLTRSQWWVLTHLFRHDGITQSELAEWLEIERPTLGRLLDRLEANGWVKREADTQDRRAKRIFLTNEVNPAMRAMRTIAAGVRSDALLGLNPDEQEAFVDTLLTIKANLSKHNNSSISPTAPSTAIEEDGKNSVKEAQS